MKKDTKKEGIRPIDETVENAYSQWAKTFTLIKKTKVKTWQGVFLIAFIAGSASALIWGVAVDIQTISEAGGETAILKMDPAVQSVVRGEIFSMDVILDTQDNDVVVTRAVINYNPDNFSLVSWDTNDSIFSSDNACIYNDKPCEIVANDAENGVMDITLSKPSEGVNTSSGVIATLTFRALQTVTNNGITFDFTDGSYDDSDVILDGSGDDGEGTDILASVENSLITVGAETCNNDEFTYSDWGVCQSDGTQSRTVVFSSPEGCVGGNPVIIQECDYNPSICEVTYSDWRVCQPGGTQSREVISVYPEGCVIENLVLIQECDYIGDENITCNEFTYSDWGVCQPDGTQSRTVASSSPENCTDGNPILTQTCNYVPPVCTSFTYSDWSDCQPDGIKSRTILSGIPEGCNTSNAVTVEGCEYISDEEFEEVVVAEVDIPRPKLRVGDEKMSFSSSQKKLRSDSKKFSFKGNAEGIEGGKVQVFIDGDLEKEVDVDNIKWKSKIKFKKDGTYSFKFKYFDSHGNQVDESGKYYVKVDTENPEFTDLPLFLSKHPGDKIWWEATDNDKIKYYKYYFNGKKKETKSASMIIPASTPSGIYTLQVRAYDKAGNKERRYVVVRVR